MRKAIAIALVVVCLIAGWWLLVMRWFQSVQPGGPTLAEVLAKMPKPDEQRVLTVGEREYLTLFGPWQSFPRFPSGPPVYVFDKAGRLVDWTPDMGEDNPFLERWPGLRRGTIVSQAQVEHWPGATQ